MKKLLLCAGVLFATIGYGQVGIGTDNPKGTLDVTVDPSVAPTDPHGVLIPRLTGDQIQAMTVGEDQNGLLAFATAPPTASIPRTSLINAEGVYYYLYSADKWYNVNEFNNSLNSALYSVNYNLADMMINRFTGGSGNGDYHNPSQSSYIWFVNGSEDTFNSNPYVSPRGANRGVKFLKSGVYSVTVQFSFVYNRDVAGDGASNANLPDRLGTQVTYNMVLNFMNSPSGSYSSNISHNADIINGRLGSGQQRVNGIATGNIIVNEDNLVEFVPEVWSNGFYIADEELQNTILGPGIRSTGALNIHILRVSDL